MNSLPNYSTQKTYFELFCAFIMRPNNCIIWNELDANNEKQIYYYTSKQIEETFRNVYIQNKKHPNGEKIKFISQWLNDETRKTFNEINFIPFNIDKEPEATPKFVYNLFDGFSKEIHTDISHLSKEERLKKIKPFLDLQLAFRIKI